LKHKKHFTKIKKVNKLMLTLKQNKSTKQRAILVT